jgi:ABC-type Fe3+/spermidine/putrescine transport system ATPase subunit
MPDTQADSYALTVEGLHKRFGSLEVLKGVSLVAREGDVISILGSSGSGKSTLLRCINLLDTPDEGVVTVAGETIQMRKLRDGRSVPADRRQVDRIRSELGMVFQSFNLWSHMTILENLIEAPVHVQKRPRAECVEGQLLPDPSIRRAAAARGDRPRAGDAAESHAIRRADFSARPRAGRRSPARHALSRRRGANDADRYPRNEFRSRRLRPRHLPAPGPGRGRRAASRAVQQFQVGALPPVHRY